MINLQGKKVVNGTLNLNNTVRFKLEELENYKKKRIKSGKGYLKSLRDQVGILGEKYLYLSAFDFNEKKEILLGFREANYIVITHENKAILEMDHLSIVDAVNRSKIVIQFQLTELERIGLESLKEIDNYKTKTFVLQHHKEFDNAKFEYILGLLKEKELYGG